MNWVAQAMEVNFLLGLEAGGSGSGVAGLVLLRLRSGPAVDPFSLWGHMACLCTSNPLFFLFLYGCRTHLMTSSNLSYLLKGSVSRTVTLGLGLRCMNLAGEWGRIQSIEHGIFSVFS